MMLKKDEFDADFYFTGQLLIAMPGMRDEQFYKTVIYLCAHTDEGAMGLVLNQVIKGLSFPNLLEQLGIEENGKRAGYLVNRGQLRCSGISFQRP